MKNVSVRLITNDPLQGRASTRGKDYQRSTTTIALEIISVEEAADRIAEALSPEAVSNDGDDDILEPMTLGTWHSV